MNHSHLVIIGGSATGISAALEARRLDPELSITLISGEHITPYARPSLMYVFMGRLRLRDLALQPEARWQELKIERLWAWVTQIVMHSEGGVLTLNTPTGEQKLSFSKLLMATGAQSKMLNCPGANLKGVCSLWGLSELAELAKHTPHSQRAVIVGGGLIGAELSEMLLTRGIKVTQFVREVRYAPHLLNENESHLVEQELRSIGVDLRCQHHLQGIHGNDRVQSVSFDAPDGSNTLDCELVGVAIGARAEIQLAEQLGLDLTKEASIKVDQGFQTSLPLIYAAGDCASVLTTQQNVWPKGWISAERQGRLVARAILEHALLPELLDQNPQLIPQISRFGRLTHTRISITNAPHHQEKLVMQWQHPRRQELLSIYAQGDQMTGISALGKPLIHQHWYPALLGKMSWSNLETNVLKECTQGLKQIL